MYLISFKANREWKLKINVKIKYAKVIYHFLKVLIKMSHLNFTYYFSNNGIRRVSTTKLWKTYQYAQNNLSWMDIN